MTDLGGRLLDTSTCLACGAALTVENQTVRPHERLAVLTCANGHTYEHHTYLRPFDRQLALPSGEGADRLVADMAAHGARQDERRAPLRRRTADA